MQRGSLRDVTCLSILLASMLLAPCIGTRILIDTKTRLGVDSEVNYWHESLGSGQHDDLWTGDANRVFRFG
jgi:hypothetical protein